MKKFALAFGFASLVGSFITACGGSTPPAAPASATQFDEMGRPVDPNSPGAEAARPEWTGPVPPAAAAFDCEGNGREILSLFSDYQENHDFTQLAPVVEAALDHHCPIKVTACFLMAGFYNMKNYTRACQLQDACQHNRVMDADETRTVELMISHCPQ